MIVVWLSKIEISWKLAKKVDFRKFLDPFWGFTLKTVPGIRDFPHFVIAFGTKNHEIWGPPVGMGLQCTYLVILSLPRKGL